MTEKEPVLQCKHIKENPGPFLIPPLKISSVIPLVNYYQYLAPNLSCIHSAGQLNEADDKEALQKMLAVAGLELGKTCRFQKTLSKDIVQGLEFSCEESICFHCQRIMCRLSTKQNTITKEREIKETYLTSLLRHIRNALAHGNTYVSENNNETNIYMIDYDVDKRKSVSAKIVTTKATLETWKAILENYTSRLYIV